jgi:hypothetical protein
MIHIGEHQYGVVDQVPGVLHVATRILHFNFMPCFPLGTVIVVDKRTVGEKTLVKTSLSPKSIAFAYFRLGLLWGAAVLLCVGFVAMEMEGRPGRPDPPWFESPGVWMVATSVLSFLGWWWSHWLTYASYARAVELADRVGIPRDVIDENFRSRGLTPSDDPMPTAAAWTNAEKDDVFRLE